MNPNVIEPVDLNMIKSQVQPIDVEKIALLVMSIKASTKIRNDAILNAT